MGYALRSPGFNAMPAQENVEILSQTCLRKEFCFDRLAMLQRRTQ